MTEKSCEENGLEGDPGEYDNVGIYSIPSKANLDECRQRGRDDYKNGVNAHDSPYVCGHPFYAWEEGYDEAKAQDEKNKTIS